jgi:hypothetical protein
MFINFFNLINYNQFWNRFNCIEFLIDLFMGHLTNLDKLNSILYNKVKLKNYLK